jgi:hypothetical protein
MPDVSKVKLGPCTVTWNAVNLGYTKGGVEVEITTAKKKIMIDQFGETEVNEYIMGRSVIVRVPLAESDLTLLASVIPGSTLVTSGVAPNQKKKLNIPTGSGVSLRDLAEKLVLHPTNELATYKDEDFVIPLATASGDITFAYRHDEERIFMVEFVGYADNVTGLLAIIGDETATP